MKVKTAVLWWLVNETSHPSLSREDQTIEGLMPLVQVMFPGINYFSMTGFSQVMNRCAIPMLRKRHPQLVGLPAANVAVDEQVCVDKVMPSDGYEWQDSPAWQTAFDQLLAAA